jgi:hypothetical protein
MVPQIFGIEISVLTIRASDEAAHQIGRDEHAARLAKTRHLRLAHSRLFNLLSWRVPIVRRLDY